MQVKAKKIFNSRNQATIEVNVDNFIGSAPSGKSTSKYEAKQYKQSLQKEISYINKTLSAKLKNFNFKKFNDFKKIENLTTKLGANSVIALEFAILQSKKGYKFLPGRKIPKPLGNVLGGGQHFNGKATDFQEFLVIPQIKTFSDAVFINMKIYRLLQETLEDKFNSVEKTDENAWAPNIDNITALDLLKGITEKISKESKIKIFLGLDIAASTFYKNNHYYYKNFSSDEKQVKLTREEQIKFIKDLIKKYNLFYVEDPLQQDDAPGFKKLKSCLICGDDLIATNLERLKKFSSCINAVIVKPNQIGSLIKVKELVDYCKKKKITPIISHRSAETNDNTIAHLAVGLKIPYIKTGVIGKERLAKLNEIVSIEKELL